MTTLKAWFATNKWRILAGVSAVVAALALILRVFVSRSAPEQHERAAALPEPPQALKKAVEQAHEDALATRAESKATADADKLQLATIAALPDGADRRRELATMLNRM